jgi:hypothetical protein
MSKKFEQLLDYLVNEEMDKANELFHEIVVEKSREIYENMIAEEAEEESVEEADDAEEESVEEADDAEEESVEEGFGMDDDESSMSIGGENDPADSMIDKVSAPEMSDDEGGEGDVSAGEEQILDVLQQLKAEFDSIVQSKGAGDDTDSDDSDDTSAEPSFGDDEEETEEEPEEEPEESMGTPMREYVENVGMNWEKNAMKTPGPVGSGKGDLAGQATETSTKSVGLQNPKGRMTSTANAKNIAQGGKGVGEMSGTSPNGKVGGFLSSPKEDNAGNGNVPGGKMGVKNLSKVPHGNKTGEGQPVGAGKGDKAGQTGGNTNTRSPADRRQ